MIRSTIRSVPVFAVLALVGASARGANAQATPEERRVDSLFSQYSQGLQPGLALAVVRDGKILLSRGYGYANLEHKVPITPTTVFDVASVSKQFAGLAVAMLVTEGKVKLSDDIRTHIPELSRLAQPVTVDHLVHHTSGYRDWPGTLTLAGWRFDDIISFDQIKTLAYNQRTLNFVPGSEYMYSNTGYNLLTEMVMRKRGKSFRQWTDETFFKPLGMTSSHFHDDHTMVVPNRALGYARRPDGSFSSVTNNLMALGSSSLFSTVEDMARWVANFDDAKVGGKAAMDVMLTRGKLNDGSTIPYAFGVSHGEYRGQPTVSHSGGWASFATYVVHFPQQRFGVVVFSNGGGVNPTRAAFNLADIYLGDALGAAAPPPGAAIANAPAVEVAPATLDRYAGVYRLGPGWYIRVRRDGSTLKAQATRESEAVLSARSDTSFWVAQYNAPISFKAVAGKPAELSYRGKQYPKLEEPKAPTNAQLRQYTGEYFSEELDTRYIVELADSGLVIRHRRHGPVRLTHAWKDDFNGQVWYMRSVEFVRNAGGRVNGLAVYIDDRSRNVRFTKTR